MNGVGMLAAQVAAVSPWNAVTITTACIAVLSFLVAGGSLALGVYNARHQIRRDFPRPRFKVTWGTLDSGSVVLRWDNEGRGEARDVQIWHRPRGRGWEKTREYGEMPFGTYNVMKYKPSATIVARLMWREDPNVHKLRRKTVRYRSKPGLTDGAHA